MKALTVRQPWAQAIAEGLKTVEVRSRPIRYRGLLAIHATGCTGRAADTSASDRWAQAPVAGDLGE